MQVFHLLFRWPITVLNAVGNGVLGLVGLRPAAGHEMVHTVEELDLLLRASQRAGMVEASEARIASRAFEFADLTAGALMTPRTELEAVPVTIGLEELLDVVASGRHTRVLVYEDSIDNILGALPVRDLIGVARRPPERFDLRALLRPVLTVPESRRADDLLEDMRAAGCDLAVVVDEYGGTAGLVTLRDLLRALVGRIDEAVAGRTSPESGLLRPAPDGSVMLDGLTRIHELEELIGRDLDEAETGGADTLGGLIMARLDRLPQVSDEVTVAGRRLRVEALHGRRVGLARLLPGPGTSR
jgi:CBS domain containing-hemolysin-like protein